MLMNNNLRLPAAQSAGASHARQRCDDGKSQARIAVDCLPGHRQGQPGGEQLRNLINLQALAATVRSLVTERCAVRCFAIMETALRKRTPDEESARTSHPAAYVRHVVRESHAELGEQGSLLRLDREAIHVHDEAR